LRGEFTGFGILIQTALEFRYAESYDVHELKLFQKFIGIRCFQLKWETGENPVQPRCCE
jgi:hypothetical protein